MSDNTFLLKQLQKPKGKLNMVLDTDTYNEIDDQYALSYFLLSREKINPLAVYAAPFLNNKSISPRDGMEKSYEEIIRVMPLCCEKDRQPPVYKGSEHYLHDEKTPAESEAARNLVKRAKEHSPENPLYVAAVGAITNVASALLMEPSIKKNIVIIFLGGNAHHLPPLPEFNMSQDIAAGRVVFGSGAPLVQLPCMGVVSHLTTTEPELRHHLKGSSALGDYLYNITCDEVKSYAAGKAWSRVIWDVSAVAWLLDEDFIWDAVIPAPIPSYDNGYIHDARRHYMKVAVHLNRDAIFADLFTKIALCK